MNRERFEELATLKGMDVTRANRRITFVNLEVIEVGEYMSRATEAAWWGAARGNEGGGQVTTAQVIIEIMYLRAYRAMKGIEL